MIQKNKGLSVRRQCELLKVNRSSLYYEPKPEDTAKEALKEEIMQRIDDWHTKCPYFGSRKILVKLQEEGYNICRKTVRNIMREMAIYSIYPKENLSKRNFKESIVPYLLRNYTVNFPNQVWSIDITYIPMKKGHMYLTAIIDWFSRKVITHYLSDTLDTNSVTTPVKEAIEIYGIPAIINSDPGSQFTSVAYKSLLKSYKIRQSMDGKSRWADNIMIERWFRSLKTEQIYPNKYVSPRELRVLINKYNEEYNKIRANEALDYQAPDDVYYGVLAA